MSIVLAEPPIASERVDVTERGILAEMCGERDLRVLWQSFSYYDGDDELCLIEQLEASYDVVIPIPVRIQRVDRDTFEASFDEANVAINGVDAQDAYQSLVAEILDTFDTLIGEPALGGPAAQQLAVLRRHIVKT